jgi:hypothetical protein
MNNKDTLMNNKQYNMKTIIIKGRPDYRARTPEQIKEFEEDFRRKHPML